MLKCWIRGVLDVHCWGTRNAEGKRLLEFAVSCDLAIGNTCFEEQSNHIIASLSQIDYVLFQKNLRKHVSDVKVIPDEETASQHHLLVCDFRADTPLTPKKTILRRLKTWYLKGPETQS